MDYLVERLSIYAVEIFLIICSLCIMEIYTLLDKLISIEYLADFHYLSSIHILLLYIGMAMLMLNAIMARKDPPIHDIIKKLLEILNNFYNMLKKKPLYCILIAILVIGLLMVMNIFCNLLGVTVCYETYVSYYITLFTRLVLIRLVIAPFTFFFTKNRYE
jgi:hypothetical protein